MARSFEGALTALVTPFREGRVDERALRELVERQIVAGIDGLVPCGTTGESPNLSTAEMAQVIGVVVDQAKGRVPVVAGAGANGTRHCIELCELARAQGVDGLLLVVPYYNKPTQAGLVAHYRAVLEAVPLPTLLYNIPGRTGVDLSVASLEQLAELPQVVGIKEATGDVLRAQDILAAYGDRFTVLSGDDALTLPTLSVGGAGVISVSSNLVPGEVAQVVKDYRAGQVAAARSLHLRLLGLHKAMFVESNPGPVKAALAMLGQIAPEIRLPLVWPEESSQARVREALRELGLK